MRRAVAFAMLSLAPWAVYAGTVDLVLVSKSDSRLYLIKDGERFASFRVSFGGELKGHKRQEGDERTPEGPYTLDSKNSNSNYYKAIHVSYPSQKDREFAKLRGVDPGGLIMIHGQKNGWGWLAPLMQWFDWTDGCIALSNKDMDVVWSAVSVGTPIEITP